jgi:hypothetical protein
MYVSLRIVQFNVKGPKKLGKNFKVKMRLRKHHDLSGQVLQRGEIFFQNLVMSYSTSKNAEFYADLKNINLP